MQHVPVTNERTWGEAVLEWCKDAERSESELLSLRKFALSFHDRGLSEVTRDAVHEALSFCKTSGTYTRYRTMIAAVLNLAVENGWLKEAPKLRVREDKKEKPREWITHEQWAALYDELPQHMKPMAEFAVETGLRQANVLGLTWKRVSLDRSLVWIEAEDAKGGAPIPIPLSKRALALLKQQAASRDAALKLDPKHSSKDFVFVYRGRPITEIKTAFISACVRAELGTVTITKDEQGKTRRSYDGFTWHGLRHTWATWHVQNGTPLDVLQKLGGWADLRMVMKYAHHTPGHLAGFADNTRKK
jgi:integrase